MNTKVYEFAQKYRYLCDRHGNKIAMEAVLL